jgi:hypothetical protein
MRPTKSDAKLITARSEEIAPINRNRRQTGQYYTYIISSLAEMRAKGQTFVARGIGKLDFQN